VGIAYGEEQIAGRWLLVGGELDFLQKQDVVRLQLQVDIVEQAFTAGGVEPIDIDT
jgi:hypothetical protein